MWIARIPLLTIAAFQGWTTFGLTFLASAVIEDLKAYVIGPRVEGRTLNMDPLLTLVAVRCGSALLGRVGADRSAVRGDDPGRVRRGRRAVAALTVGRRDPRRRGCPAVGHRDGSWIRRRN